MAGALPRGDRVFGLVISLDGQFQSIHYLEGLSRDISDFRPYFRRVDVQLRQFFTRQFAREGQGPRHGNWKKLSKGYGKRKRQLRPGRKKLVFDGTMRRALTRKADSHGLRIMTKDQYAFGTKGIPYASTHQKGYDNIPARPMIDLDKRFRDQLRKDLEWHVRKAAIRQRRQRGMGPGTGRLER